MVARQEVIHMYRVCGMSKREIARTLNISRNTVEKILSKYNSVIKGGNPDEGLEDLLTIQPRYDSSKRVRRKLTDEIKSVIDECLKKNAAKIAMGLRKQRMLKKDIYLYLQNIKQGRNVVLYGNPGTGKTHIATALGIRACQYDYSVLFTSVPTLLTQIREAKSSKTLRSLQLRFEKYDLVICDEFGYVSCDKEGGELLFNHLSLRAGKKATIITTNLAFNRWNEIIKDKVLVAAMVDRLTHKAILINMSGQSYRLKETQKMRGQK